jgi:hypothetical protein
LVSIHRFGIVLAAAALLAGAGQALAQGTPTFAIRGYQVEGNSLLPPGTVSVTVMPFTGPKSSFETIQLALEALEKAYLKAGYGSVRIEVPEQDIQDGGVFQHPVHPRTRVGGAQPGAAVRHRAASATRRRQRLPDGA